MIYRILILTFLVFVASCDQKKKTVPVVPTTDSNTVKTYDFNSFEKTFLQPKTDKIQVINFWATWCLPCIKELPYFEELSKKNKDIEVILVSLDLSTQTESKLISLVKKEKLKSNVILLDESDATVWIPKVDTSWSGAIPATMIINKNKKIFYEQSFNYTELIEAINSFKNEK